MEEHRQRGVETRQRRLSIRKQESISTILAAPSLTAAAREIGIHVRTLHRWLEDEEFSAAVERARRDRMRRASNRLQGLAAPAITGLLGLLGEENPPSVRLQAVRVAVQFAYKSFELDDLMERMEELEKSLERNGI